MIMELKLANTQVSLYMMAVCMTVMHTAIVKPFHASISTIVTWVTSILYGTLLKVIVFEFLSAVLYDRLVSLPRQSAFWEQKE